MPARLLERLVQTCLDALPHKAYGLIGGTDLHHPQHLYPCRTNLRNTSEWDSVFAGFGEYYTDPDKGFVVAPEEYWAITKEMERRNESLIGVFHSHRCRGAEPSEVDRALSSSPDLPAYIVSVMNRARPDVRVFRLLGTSFEELCLRPV